MVNKCIAPNCDYNYDSERKRRRMRQIPIFAFPNYDDNPEKRVQWIGTPGKLTPKERIKTIYLLETISVRRYRHNEH